MVTVEYHQVYSSPQKMWVFLTFSDIHICLGLYFHFSFHFKYSFSVLLFIVATEHLYLCMTLTKEVTALRLCFS